MRRQLAAVAVLSTAAAVLSLAGCGGSSSTNPNNPSSDNFKSLPAAEQQSFETAAVDEITADIASFTSLSPYAGLFFEKVAPNRFNGALRMARVKQNAPRFQTASCAATTGDLTDPDGDGVYNADTTTFNCSQTSGGETISETGIFAYGDPTPNTADLDVGDGANLTASITGSSDGDINLTLNGSASITEGTGVINLTGNWNINEQLSNNPQGYNGTFKLTANETASYSFSGTAPTTFGTLPEPGKFTVSGSWTYDIAATNKNINLSFTVSTPTPLNIDGCSGNTSGIDSGEVDIKFADGTLVKAAWTKCQATPSISVT